MIGDGETVGAATVMLIVADVPPALELTVKVHGLLAALLLRDEIVKFPATAVAGVLTTPPQPVDGVKVKVVVPATPACVTLTIWLWPSELYVRLVVALPFTRTAAAVDDAVEVGDAVVLAVAVAVAAAVAAAVAVAVADGVGVVTGVTVVLVLLHALMPSAMAIRTSHGLNFFMHPHYGSA